MDDSLPPRGVDEVKAVFETLDSDGDGWLSMEETRLGLLACGVIPTPGGLESMRARALTAASVPATASTCRLRTSKTSPSTAPSTSSSKCATLEVFTDEVTRYYRQDAITPADLAQVVNPDCNTSAETGDGRQHTAMAWRLHQLLGMKTEQGTELTWADAGAVLEGLEIPSSALVDTQSLLDALAPSRGR